MIRHTSLGDETFKRCGELKTLIDSKQISFAGNVKLKIYGRLSCISGKRIKVKNRVFFIPNKKQLTWVLGHAGIV